MTSRSTALLLSALACLLPASSLAHHVVSETGISWVEPVNVLEARLEASSFDHGRGFTGQWQTLTLSAEWTPISSFSLRAQLPIAHLHLDDGRRVVGPGDIEASAKWRIFATQHGGFIASAGLGAAAPTADASVGLGAGHFELAPFLALSSAPSSRLVFFGALIDKFALGTSSPSIAVDARAAHGALFAPHEPHELAARLGVAFLPTDSLYISARLDPTFVFADPSKNTSRAHLEAGWSAPGRWRVSIAASEHLWGTPRNQLSLSTSLALFLPSSS